ncbi:MAG: D-alanine--D-alanine ligase [Bacillota bacterium]
MAKIRVGLIFGGRSSEHEVSLQSAKSIYEALDKDRYEPVLIGIDKSGVWHVGEASVFFLNSDNPKLIALNKDCPPVVPALVGKDRALVEIGSGRSLGKIDVVFPIIHGTYGEDGSLQGLLRMMDVPYVGADVLGSAIGMDKDIMKRLLRDAGISVASWVTVRYRDRNRAAYDNIVEQLGLPLFVKPANLGSSVGVSKVYSIEELSPAIDEAFRYDRKVLIEEFVQGREIECSVLGNDDPVASLPGEILPNHDFYSYDAKYIDENGAVLQIPADLDQALIAKVQETAVRVFEVLECSGMARVDFFLKDNGDLIVNEINTLPGFTRISMYPKLWEVSGLPYSELLDRLIHLAIERHARERELHRSYNA